MSFGDFYAMGGVFMHAVTACALGMAFYVLSYYLRRGKAANEAAFRTGVTDGIRAMIVGALLFGALGTLMGFMEAFGAVQTVPADEWNNALARGLSISLHTLAWAVMASIPGWFAYTMIADRRVRPAPAPDADTA